jgi:hypothetical protein
MITNELDTMLDPVTESTVYITAANAVNIVKKIDPDKLRKLNGILYKRAIYVFGAKDKARLLGIRELFKHPEEFIRHYYVKHDVFDSYQYVFEGKPPAYHRCPECERLNSDYTNYEVPSFIRDQGKAAVLEFRAWFKANMHLIEKDRWDWFQLRFQEKYGIVIQPTEIERPNSGITRMENLDLATLESRIDRLIDEAIALYKSTPFHREVICRWGKNAWLGRFTDKPLQDNRHNLDEKAVRAFLCEYDRRIIQPLKWNLIEYYKVSANPELAFSGRLLEQLGFHACRSCHHGMA